MNGLGLIFTIVMTGLWVWSWDNSTERAQRTTCYDPPGGIGVLVPLVGGFIAFIAFMHWLST